MIRARPLLGTRVDIRVEISDVDAVNATIDRGFAAVAEILSYIYRANQTYQPHPAANGSHHTGAQR